MVASRLTKPALEWKEVTKVWLLPYRTLPWLSNLTFWATLNTQILISANGETVRCYRERKRSEQATTEINKCVTPIMIPIMTSVNQTLLSRGESRLRLVDDRLPRRWLSGDQIRALVVEHKDSGISPHARSFSVS